jgi:hypothetical protein
VGAIGRKRVIAGNARQSRIDLEDGLVGRKAAARVSSRHS